MTITANDLQGMVSHWLGCPPNGYLGSTYGSDLDRLVQSPFAAGVADAVVAKLRNDVPIIGRLDGDAVNLLAEQQGADQMVLHVEVAGSFVLIDQGSADVPQV